MTFLPDADGEVVAVSVRKRHFLRCHLYIKCIILPRQARDKHRESTQKSAVFSQYTLWDGHKVPAPHYKPPTGPVSQGYSHVVRGTPFGARFYVNALNLPRQARDKHRKSCKKKAVLQVYRLTNYTAAATSIRAKTEDEDAAPWLSLAVSSRLRLHGRAEAQCE
jgi:hypothetical protein